MENEMNFLENDELDINRFKKWLDHNNLSKIKMEESNIKTNTSSQDVVPRLGLERLVLKIKEHNQLGEVMSCDIAKTFKENGGKILKTEGSNFFIESKEYKFYLPKMYVK